MQQRMDELLDLAEKLSTSMDVNDRTTLKESVASLNSKLTLACDAAVQKETQLTESLETWNDYQVDFEKFVIQINNIIL